MPVKKESGAAEVVEKTSKDFKEIRARCLAEGKLFEDPDFPPTADEKWLRPKEICNNPQFYVDGPSRFDVGQGAAADCGVVATIACLTLHKKLIYQVVPDDQGFDKDYAGVFHFRFWGEESGHWVEVVIDDRLPTNSEGGLKNLFNNTNKNEFWSPLLEKAYAKHRGSYGSLVEWPSLSMRAFTGGVTEWRYKDDINAPDFYTTLLKAYERNSLIAAASYYTTDNHPSTPGIPMNHAYSITGVKCVDIKTPERADKIRLVRIRNPWGISCEWTGAWGDRSPEWNNISQSQKEELGLTFNPDGEFWMSFEDFLKAFKIVQICTLNPDALDPEEYPKECNKKWETAVFEGEWAKGVSRSPQYTVTLTDTDEGDDENKCTMIVDLMPKNSDRVTSLTTHAIGFAVYKLPDNKHVSMPLDVNSLNDNECIGRCQNLTKSREATARFKLDPGTYVIVPSTFGPDQEGEFLLRVFSEKAINMAEHVVRDESDADDPLKEVSVVIDTEPVDTEPVDTMRVLE